MKVSNRNQKLLRLCRTGRKVSSMESNPDIIYVKKVLKEVDVLLQMSEEASELSQAAAKRARILVGRNPTPVTEPESYETLLEEYADVKVCASALLSSEALKYVENQVMPGKIKRWVERLKTSSCDATGKPISNGDVVYGVDGNEYVVCNVSPVSPANKNSDLSRLFIEASHKTSGNTVLLNCKDVFTDKHNEEYIRQAFLNNVLGRCNNGIFVDGCEKYAGDVVYGLSDGKAWIIKGVDVSSKYPVDAVLQDNPDVRKQLKVNWLTSEPVSCECPDGKISIGTYAYINDPVSVKGFVKFIAKNGESIQVGIKFPALPDVVYVDLDNVRLKNPDSQENFITDVLYVLQNRCDAKEYCVKRKIACESANLTKEDYEKTMIIDVKSRMQRLYNKSE